MYTKNFANEIAQAKFRAHQCIDSIWRDPNERTLVYQWMAFQFGDRAGMNNGRQGKAHIRFLNSTGCDRLISLVEEIPGSLSDKMSFIREWNERSRPAFLERGKMVLNDFIDQSIFFEAEPAEQIVPQAPQPKKAKPQNRHLGTDEELEFIRQHFENLKALSGDDQTKLSPFYQLLLFQLDEILFSYYPKHLQESVANKLEFLQKQTEMRVELMACFRKAIRESVIKQKNVNSPLTSAQPNIPAKQTKNKKKGKKNTKPTTSHPVRADKEQQKSTREWNRQVLAEMAKQKMVAPVKEEVTEKKAVIKPYQQELDILLGSYVKLQHGSTAQKMFVLCGRLDDLYVVQQMGKEDLKFQKLVTQKMLEVAGSIVVLAEHTKTTRKIDSGKLAIKNLHSIKKIKSVKIALQRVLGIEQANSFVVSLDEIIAAHTTTLMDLIPPMLELEQENVRCRESEVKTLFQVHCNLLLLLDIFAAANSFSNPEVQNACLIRYIRQMSMVFAYLAEYVKAMGLSTTTGQVQLVFTHMTCVFDSDQQIAITQLIASELSDDLRNIKQNLFEEIRKFREALINTSTSEFKPSEFYPKHYQPSSKAVKLNQANQKVRLQPLFCEIHSSNRANNAKTKTSDYDLTDFVNVCKSLIDPSLDWMRSEILTMSENIHNYAVLQMAQDARRKKIDLRKTYGIGAVFSQAAATAPHPKNHFSLDNDLWSLIYYSSELMYNTHVQFLLHSPTPLNKYVMKFVTQVHNEIKQHLVSMCYYFFISVEEFTEKTPLEQRLGILLDGFKKFHGKFRHHPEQEFIRKLLQNMRGNFQIYINRHAEALFEAKLYDSSAQQYEELIKIINQDNSQKNKDLLLTAHRGLALVYETTGQLAKAESQRDIIDSLDQDKHKSIAGPK